MILKFFIMVTKLNKNLSIIFYFLLDFNFINYQAVKMNFENLINEDRKFTIDFGEHIEKLTEGDFERLLKYITEKSLIIYLVFSPSQESAYNKSIFKQSIIARLNRNKIFQGFLNDAINHTVDLRTFTEKLNENDFNLFYEFTKEELILDLRLTPEQKSQFDNGELKLRDHDDFALIKKNFYY